MKLLFMLCLISGAWSKPSYVHEEHRSTYEIPPDEETIGNVGHWAGTKPVHYAIYIQVINEIQYKASVRIVVEAVEDTNVIFLNALPDFIKRLRCPYVKPLNGHGYIRIKGITWRDNVFKITFHGCLRKQRKYVLNFLYFTGGPKAQNNTSRMVGYGITLSNHKLAMAANRTSERTPYWIWTTLFEMRMARSVFPCYDHPALKATFSLCMQHDKDVRVYSNTHKISEKRVKNFHWKQEETRETCFAQTPLMSTYLFSFAAGKNIVQESRMLGKSGIEFDLICVPSVHCPTAMEAISPRADKYISTMEHYTGQKYPLKKLGYVFSDMISVAMENFGLIVSFSQLHNRYNIIAHEIVHQWIGNIVTIKHWSNVCLQEGLTTYLGYSLNDKWARAHVIHGFNLTYDSFNLPLINTKNPLVVACYSKGAVVFSMLEDYHGSENSPLIPKFMRHLMDECKWSNCDLKQWKQALTRASGGDDNPSRALESFYTTPGFPLLLVKSVGDGLTIRQILVSNMTTKQSHFIIPLMYNDSMKNTQKIIMDKPNLKLDNIRNSRIDANGECINDTNTNLSISIDSNTYTFNMSRAPGSWFTIGSDMFWGVIFYPMENYISILSCLVQTDTQSLNNTCDTVDTKVVNDVLGGLSFCGEYVPVKYMKDIYPEVSDHMWNKLAAIVGAIKKQLKFKDLQLPIESIEKCINNFIMNNK